MKAVRSPRLPILLVDDEVSALQSFEFALRSRGINHLLTCSDSRDVAGVMAARPVELVLMDLWMPHVSGEELLVQIVADHPEVPVIVVTGSNDAETAVRCMKTGAFDYLVKPVERDRLVTTVGRAIELRDLQEENARLQKSLLSSDVEHPEAFAELVTRNPSMMAIFQYVEAIAQSSHPVLITGETGVGKELIARAVHDLSRRAGEFVTVNVAGLDDVVFADTLFGHLRGAFTGADRVRMGLVERAAGGTLFLDEIGDLHANAQVKLLRLLQEREYFPLGADMHRRTDARVVVATNAAAETLKNSPTFRKDLFYRLRGHHIHVPPLRERLDDLPLLVDHFLREAAETLGKKKPTPPKELVSVLGTYHFPGNVRELRSMVFDAVSRHRSKMLSMDAFKLAVGLCAPTEGTRMSSEVVFPETLPTLRQVEDLLVSEAMERAGGNQATAARLLGISRQALNRRIRTRTSD